MQESPQVLALKALRAINKSSTSALQLDDVPKELLLGPEVDLHRWTMVLKDEALKTLSEQPLNENRFYMKGDSNELIDLFNGFWTPRTCPYGLLSLNISNAKEVTDYGITMIARRSPHLKTLNINANVKITDVGIREIGMNCSKIQNLIMSSCHGVEGSGLVSIAECCRGLIKLDVSKCSKLQNWSITKVFYDCINLEDVNVSGMKVVGDEEIRVLAQNCPNLTKLVAVECHYISDASILVLSQHCFDLDYVDVSRTNMSFRITDLCMMALSQRCHSLRTIHANGCDIISDVGLTWLSEGCKMIESLEVSHCPKITDAGLRSIGNECHSLTNVNISHSKNVTDIGVASLSSGCPKLKHLNCHGAFLLSDPRLSAPKKGAKLEAWQTVIGVAALSTNCPNIESLDLSGCFRLNIALHQYVSNLKLIRKLNLQGCNQASPESIAAVARGCLLIEELNLSDCGKAVTNESMTAFGLNCPELKSISLCRCDYFRGDAIRAISLCSKLEKLDISACKYLTDTMLLYLCEVDKVPELRTLNIIDIPKLTDSILAWISIKPQKILLLAAKGTSISQKALMSVRDRFPNSDMLNNENFYGFWPKFRVADRILLNKYFKIIEGIVKIQSRHRKFKAAVRVAGITTARHLKKTQLFVQRVIRGYLGRCRARHARRKRDIRIISAQILINIFRIAVARKRVRRRKHELHVIFINKTAVKLQVRWRMHRDKKKLKALKLAKLRHHEKRKVAATRIQAMGRKYFAVNRVRRIKTMIRAKGDLHNMKAMIIQNIYRRHRAYLVTMKFKQMRDYLMANQNRAATTIQRFRRAKKTNQIVMKGRALHYHMMRCIIKAQSLMRGFLARLHVAEILTEVWETKRIAAAIRIQGRLRVIMAKKEFNQLMKDRLRRRRGFESAATKINNAARMKLARLSLYKKKYEWTMNARHRANLEIESAVKIQALVRGIAGRVSFEQSLREKKGKWKELFDEKKQKRFFYNKLTGEIRWRMPQDLLDLIPHPICDNCNHTDATLECNVCNEMYCSTCFNNVHSGGRRREHEFRSLYDFYGKRLDYGDGIFPSKWPSEVVQDEVQGWMLRVAPIRECTRRFCRNQWELYSGSENIYSEDAHRHSKSTHAFDYAPQPSFYFNRKTFETSYEVPQEVAEELKNELAARSQGYYDENGNWTSSDLDYDWSATHEQDATALVPASGSETYPNTRTGTAELINWSNESHGYDYDYDEQDEYPNLGDGRQSHNHHHHQQQQQQEYQVYNPEEYAVIEQQEYKQQQEYDYQHRTQQQQHQEQYKEQRQRQRSQQISRNESEDASEDHGVANWEPDDESVGGGMSTGEALLYLQATPNDVVSKRPYTAESSTFQSLQSSSKSQGQLPDGESKRYESFGDHKNVASFKGPSGTARDAPPTARSARDGTSVPVNATRLTHNGQSWVQLWDPEQSSMYWYCEATGAAQWEAPSSIMGSQSATVVSATPRTARDAPPTARSARDGTGIPPDAARLTYKGQVWVQLWDPEQSSMYWYCEATQAAQWESPGSNGEYQSGRLGAPTPRTARDAPPTARSARGGGGIPRDAPRLSYNGQNWVQLWDPEQSSMYWYCEATGAAQWEAPGGEYAGRVGSGVQSGGGGGSDSGGYGIAMSSSEPLLSSRSVKESARGKPTITKHSGKKKKSPSFNNELIKS